MQKVDDLDERFALHFDPAEYRRRISGKDVIIHCHHYNARFQRAVEQPTAIDGKALFVSSAEAVFAEHLRLAFRPYDDEAAMWKVAQRLYTRLGYGTLDVASVDDGIVFAPHSHYVEGWRAGFRATEEPVCSLTEGYLQAAFALITGQPAYVREQKCRLQTAAPCTFHIDTSRTDPLAQFPFDPARVPPTGVTANTLQSANVDEQAIIDAVVQMPVYGGMDGLIPAFNVYLANTPADFYNLVTIRYLEAMAAVDLGEIARDQLVAVAETCAMNTFRGIISSAEWDALIAPMVREPADRLFGLIAVSNALGWGNWSVAAHQPEESLSLTSANGYEAAGYTAMRGASESPQCLMLTGVSAGMMELLYGEGPFETRFGQYQTAEGSCRCCGEAHCTFNVEAA